MATSGQVSPVAPATAAGRPLCTTMDENGRMVVVHG